MARRRFFVDEIRNHRAEVAGDDAHHLSRVLRVERGQQYEISDNQSIWLASVSEAHKNRVVFDLIQPVDPRPVPVRLTICVALIKFERMEWIFEKGTELGVSEFVLIKADRSEKGLDLAAVKRLERWRRIVREASEQSRRDHLPPILAPVSLSAALAGPYSPRILLDEEPGAPPILGALPEQRSPEQSVAVLLGPEGGWTAGERASAVQAGWQPVSLGPQILRAETAAVAAAAIVMAAWTSR